MTQSAGVATVRAVAFDWGGIFTQGTFDSDAVRNLARLCGATEEQVERIYLPLMVPFEAGDIDLAEFTARFRKESGLSFDDREFQETFLASGIEREEMYAALAAIPEGYTVGMLSNNVEKLCDRVRNDPRMARVEHFLFSNEIRVRKPDPEAFRHLTEALGVPPAGTVFIDDNEANISAARELGFQGILLRDFPGFLEEFTALLPELEERLRQHAG